MALIIFTAVNQTATIEAWGATGARGRTAGSSEGPRSRSVDKAVGYWYYIALIADGKQTQLNSRVSFLDLRPDGTFENSFGGRGSQVGTYKVAGNRLTLNAENKDPMSYTMTFAEDGEKTFKLSSSTLTLINKDEDGYKLQK